MVCPELMLQIITDMDLELIPEGTSIRRGAEVKDGHKELP